MCDVHKLGSAAESYPGLRYVSENEGFRFPSVSNPQPRQNGDGHAENYRVVRIVGCGWDRMVCNVSLLHVCICGFLEQ